MYFMITLLFNVFFMKVLLNFLEYIGFILVYSDARQYINK